MKRGRAVTVTRHSRRLLILTILITCAVLPFTFFYEFGVSWVRPASKPAFVRSLDIRILYGRIQLWVGEYNLGTELAQKERERIVLRRQWLYSRSESRVWIARWSSTCVELVGFGSYHSTEQDGSWQRTIAIPMWAIVAGAVALLVLYAKRNRPRSGYCRKCGYDLRASPQRCPECGEAKMIQA